MINYQDCLKLLKTLKELEEIVNKFIVESNCSDTFLLKCVLIAGFEDFHKIVSRKMEQVKNAVQMWETINKTKGLLEKFADSSPLAEVNEELDGILGGFDLNDSNRVTDDLRSELLVAKSKIEHLENDVEKKTEHIEQLKSQLEQSENRIAKIMSSADTLISELEDGFKKIASVYGIVYSPSISNLFHRYKLELLKF